MKKEYKMEKFDQKIKDKISPLRYAQDPDTELMSEMFERLERKQNEDSSTINFISKRVDLRSYRILFRMAAAFIILLMAGIILHQINEVDLYASKGNKLIHDLPDGSIIHLNADSKLDYNKLLWLINRNVSLEGEAYFDVEKGKKFNVFSERGQTQVLGTGFNVYSRNQDYKVECIEGSVKVSYLGSSDDIVLLAGHGAHIGTSDQIMLYNFSIEDRIDWRKGEFYFNNESLNNVFETLSRQFDIDLRFIRDINNIKYTGYFNDKNLESALKLICDPVDLSYQIRDGYVVIE